MVSFVVRVQTRILTGDCELFLKFYIAFPVARMPWSMMEERCAQNEEGLFKCITLSYEEEVCSSASHCQW